MSFSKFFNGQISGYYLGGNTTSGAFTATIIEGSNGTLSGSWSYSGVYDDPYQANAHGSVSFSGTITGSKTGSTSWNVNYLSSDPRLELPGNPGSYGHLVINGANTQLTVSLVFDIAYLNNFDQPRTDTFSTSTNLNASALPPIISFDHGTSSVSEDMDTISVTLTRSGADLSGESKVYLSTQDGAASSTGLSPDFNAVKNLEVVFAPNVKSVTVSLPGTVIDDTVQEANEDFHLSLSDPVNGALGFSTATVTIIDNDQDGTGGPDKMQGGKGNDDLEGGGGDDSLDGGAGNDKLDGGAGNDKLDGGAGNDALNGGADNDTASYANAPGAVIADLSQGKATVTNGKATETDTLTGIENLIGSKFADTLTGDGGDNIIDGGLGNDTLDGAGGNDTVSYASAAAGVTVDLRVQDGTTGQKTGGGGTDILNHFENLTGGPGNDVLTGNDNDNVILGLGGNDLITGGGGNDVLDGGVGTSDTVSYAGALGDVTVDLTKSSAQDTKGAGKDTVLNFENVIGSQHNDSLTGNAGNNIIDGGAGNDLIEGGDGNDTLIGGLGASDGVSFANASAGVTVNLSATAAQKTGGAGSDKLSGFENLTGSAFDDALAGDKNSNVIDGGAGNDLVVGSVGADTLIGGAEGSVGDVVSYLLSTMGVTVDLKVQDGVTAQISAGDATGDILSGFEHVVGSGKDDKLTGDGNSNVIEGLLGNDVLIGGANSALGDFASYRNSTAAVIVSLAIQDGTTAQDTKGAGKDTLSGFENLRGGAGGDTLTGDGNDNQLLGDAGSDVLIGGAGNDTLDGGTGNDTLAGGAGADVLVGDGKDTASYSGDTAGVTVTLGSASPQTGGDAAGDTLVGGIANLTGGSGGDMLTGDGNANVIQGGNGDDTIEGGAGNDTLAGGGNTPLGDTLSYAGDSSGVTVSLALPGPQKTGGEGTDTVSGFENLTGGAANDALTGDKSVNAINGGGGDDVLIGGGGADTLTGGMGNDTFRFLNPADGGDVLFDFDNSTQADKISIVKAGFGIMPGVTVGGTGKNSFADEYFVSATTVAGAATKAHGQFIYDTDDTRLFWDSDGTGAKAAMLIADLPDGTALTATDFELK